MPFSALTIFKWFGSLVKQSPNGQLKSLRWTRPATLLHPSEGFGDHPDLGYPFRHSGCHSTDGIGRMTPQGNMSRNEMKGHRNKPWYVENGWNMILVEVSPNLGFSEWPDVLESGYVWIWGRESSFVAWRPKESKESIWGFRLSMSISGCVCRVLPCTWSRTCRKLEADTHFLDLPWVEKIIRSDHISLAHIEALCQGNYLKIWGFP